MSTKLIVITVLFAFLLLSGSCQVGEDGNPSGSDTTAADTTDTTTTADTGAIESYGTFQIMLREEGVTAVLGRMYDGPLPSKPPVVWEVVETAGGCCLLKPRTPLCAEPCEWGYLCVEDDSCQLEPSAISVGTVTVNGLKLTNGTAAFSMDHIGFNYQPPITDTLTYPPFNEGDVVTLSASGSQSISAFTLTARGFSPLEVLNESFPCADGQPIELKWTPPGLTGNTTIFVLVDISYHGGTKAKIECDCEDDGSLTIAASLLDKLKTYGISGYPKIEVSRKAVAIDTITRAKMVIESKVTRFLEIPGIITCSSDEQCPEGQYCAGDQRCREIE
ncbi:MAG: hypothetical protein JXA18_09900 [Chitinispirillaceae bacterium]|nr:hypothetical protein [Chitinispirillaceae bacterium]